VGVNKIRWKGKTKASKAVGSRVARISYGTRGHPESDFFGKKFRKKRKSEYGKRNENPRK